MADHPHALVRGQGAATLSVKVRNAFIGRTEQPADDDRSQALGLAKPLWDGLVTGMTAQYGAAAEWKSYSPKAGWALRLMRGKRTILWLAPFEGCLEVLFILGDKTLLAARQGGLSTRALRAFEQAKRYPEGTGVRFLVKGPRDIPTI